MKFLFPLVLALVASVAVAQDSQKIIDHLQDISVTVRSDGSGFGGQGSGTLVTRKRGDETITFVWTAAHVVDNLRSTRPFVDPKTGSPKLVIEFKDADIVQEFRQNGRRIGEIKMSAQVIRYSDAENGEDLALLRVRKTGFTSESQTASFYLDSDIPAVGTPLYHVGSLLGQVGSNSLTTGVISQQGRVLDLGNGGGVIFDQTTATAFPGSSGGGVYSQKDGRYVGMLVRGAGEGFNFIVPTRRLNEWAKKAKVEWAVNPAIAVPSDEELKKLTVEDSGVTFESADRASAAAKGECPGQPTGYRDYAPFLLITKSKPAVEAPKAVEAKKSLLESLLSK